MAEFNAGTLNATITKVVIQGGMADVTIMNSDLTGNLVSEVTIKIPASVAVGILHSRTGDTAITPSQDLVDAIASVSSEIEGALADVIAAGKHAP